MTIWIKQIVTNGCSGLFHTDHVQVMLPCLVSLFNCQVRNLSVFDTIVSKTDIIRCVCRQTRLQWYNGGDEYRKYSSLIIESDLTDECEFV
jgi:hypothetical protein